MARNKQVVSKHRQDKIYDFSPSPKRYKIFNLKTDYEWDWNSQNWCFWLSRCSPRWNLTWKSHTDQVVTKLSKNSGIINKLNNYLPLHIMKALYNSLVQPHINYAISMGYKCNWLVKLQKRLVRIITSSKYNAHADSLFKRTELLKVADTLDIITWNSIIHIFIENCHDIFTASKSWSKDPSTLTTRSKGSKSELSAHEPNIVTTD